MACLKIERVTAPKSAAESQASASPARLKVLELVLRLGPNVELVKVVEQIGGHPNGTRRHLDALEKSGLVVAGTRRTSQSGRPAKVYTITDAGRRVDAERHSQSTQGEMLGILTSHLATEANGAAEARELGRQWGERQRGRDLGEALRVQGYAPTEGERPGEIVLLSCPIRDAVAVDAGVACSLHRGFLEAALGGGVGSVELIPFGSPRGCVVRIASAGSTGEAEEPSGV